MGGMKRSPTTPDGETWSAANLQATIFGRTGRVPGGRDARRCV